MNALTNLPGTSRQFVNCPTCEQRGQHNRSCEGTKGGESVGHLLEMINAGNRDFQDETVISSSLMALENFGHPLNQLVDAVSRQGSPLPEINSSSAFVISEKRNIPSGHP
jgi:hypothetical protein